MTRAAIALAAACAACAPAPRAPIVAVAPAPAAPPVVTERDAPLDRLEAALRAYLEGDDTRAIAAMWADELEVRAGRARKPTKYDARFGKARLAAIYGWAADHMPRMEMRVVSPRVDLEGSVATIEWSLVLASEKGPAAFGERYRLEKRGAEWKMLRFEYWPLDPDTLAEIGTAYFAEADAKVEDARARGDDRNVAYWLMAAYRFDECAEIARRLTDATPEEPWVWEMRAKASALVGDRADADRAMREHDRIAPRP